MDREPIATAPGLCSRVTRSRARLAYDPEDANLIAAGAIDAGVFLSVDGGARWMRVTTDHGNAPTAASTLQRLFRYHEPGGTTNLYVGTQGRGVWRIQVRLPTANAGGPYTTVEGTNVSLAGTGTVPDNAPLLFEWDLDNDGQFDDAVGQYRVRSVGQDGVFTVRLRVTAGGASAIATTTVTVTNVAPTVAFTSDAPKPENATMTINILGHLSPTRAGWTR